MKNNHILLCAVTVFVIAGVAYSEEDNTFTSVPIIQQEDPHAALRQSSQKALTFLSSSQNEDGSIGRDNQIRDTALVIMAFTRNPRHATSRSDVLSAASDWLRKCTPKTDSDRLAIAIAISGLQSSATNSQENGKGLTADSARIQALFVNVDSSQIGLWGDALALTKLPEGLVRPQWAHHKADLRNRLRKTTSTDLESFDDYLWAYLVCIEKSWDNDRDSKSLALAVKGKQNEDGLMKTSDDRDFVGATALVALYPTVYSKTADEFFNSPPSQSE